MAVRFELTDTVQRAVSAALNVVSGSSAAPSTETVLTAGAGLSVTVKDLQGNNLTVYAAETGTSTVPNPLTADSGGRISGWVYAPDYDLTVTGTGVVSSTQNIRTSPAGVANVCSYGADPLGSADSYSAFAAAHSALPTNGGKIHVPAGTYLTSSTWTISNLCVIEGAGNGVNLPSGAGSHPSPTLIKPAAGTTGITIAGSQNPPVVIRDLSLLSRSTGSGTDDGIQVQGHAAVLDHVTISNFGRRGVSADTSVSGNANNSHFRAVRCEYNRGDGFYVNGANSQAMLFEVCDASSNSGWGFYGAGSATNVYDHPHCAGNTLGAFYDNGSSNFYIAPYVESGTGNNVTFDTGASGMLWLNPGAYTTPPITDNGSNNLKLTSGGSGVPTWSQLTTTGDITLTGPTHGVYHFSMQDVNQLFARMKVSGDANDRFRVTGAGTVSLGDGTAAPDAALKWYSSAVVGTDNNWAIKGVGKGLRVAEGSNAKMGTATLNGTTEVTVNNTSVTANSRILLTIQAPGGTVGSPYVSSRSAGTSFGVKSTNAADTSTVAYHIVEPA